jgi:DNA-binding response OmpR family regulator
LSAPEHEPEGLSREELRELLGEALGAIRGGADAGGGTAPGQRLLLATRRGQDAHLIQGRAVAHGASLEIVRNAFSALDKLRTGTYAAILSDLDLWANDGRLLLERVGNGDEPLSVVFLVERERRRSQPPLEDLPGVRVLNCPLEAGELEEALRAVLSTESTDPLPEAVPGDETSGDGASDETSGDDDTFGDGKTDSEQERLVSKATEGEFDEEGGGVNGDELVADYGSVEGEGDSAEVESAGEKETERPLPRASGAELGELSWLRFLVKGYRAVHEDTGGGAALVRLASDELGALAAGLLWRQGSRTAAHLESQAGTDSLLFKRVLEAARDRKGDEKGLVVNGGDATLAILGLPPPFRTAALPYFDDLRCLLEAWSATLE